MDSAAREEMSSAAPPSMSAVPATLWTSSRVFSMNLLKKPAISPISSVVRMSTLMVKSPSLFLSRPVMAFSGLATLRRNSVIDMSERMTTRTAIDMSMVR